MGHEIITTGIVPDSVVQLAMDAYKKAVATNGHPLAELLGLHLHGLKPLGSSTMATQIEALFAQPVAETPAIYEHGNLSYDTRSQIVHLSRAEGQGTDIQLTPRAGRLLEALMQDPTGVIGEKSLMKATWTSKPRALDVCIFDLRRSLGDRRPDFQVVHNVWGTDGRGVSLTSNARAVSALLENERALQGEKALPANLYHHKTHSGKDLFFLVDRNIALLVASGEARWIGLPMIQARYLRKLLSDPTRKFSFTELALEGLRDGEVQTDSSFAMADVRANIARLRQTLCKLLVDQSDQIIYSDIDLSRYSLTPPTPAANDPSQAITEPFLPDFPGKKENPPPLATPSGILEVVNSTRELVRTPLRKEGNNLVELRPVLFTLLLLLMSEPRRVFNEKEIYNALTQQDKKNIPFSQGIMRAHIHRLRTALGDAYDKSTGRSKLIHTITEAGISLVSNEQVVASFLANPKLATGEEELPRNIYSFKTTDPKVENQDLILFSDRYVALSPRKPGEIVQLTRTESIYLQRLMARPGEVHTGLQLMQAAARPGEGLPEDDNTARVNIFRLCERLGYDRSEDNYPLIYNIKNRGYSLKPPLRQAPI